MRPTIRDIARRASVSPSTVSRVLNNYEHVGESTRALVEEAARALNYSLEHLRSGKINLTGILLLTGQGENDLDRFSVMSVGGTEAAIALGVSEFISGKPIHSQIKHTTMNPDEVPLFQRKYEADGLILLGGMWDHAFVQALIDAEIPFVIAGAHVKPLQVNCVMADYIHGMELAVEHLVEHGKTRIGLINGSPRTKSSAAKYKGLRLALALRGLPFTPEQELSSEFSFTAGYENTFRLLDRAPFLDAIIYTNDQTATGGLRALKERRYQIPRDMAVIGFQDMEQARFTDPPLTMVHFSGEQLGYIAARRLMMLLDNTEPEEPWMTIIPTSLVIREST